MTSQSVAPISAQSSVNTCHSFSMAEIRIRSPPIVLATNVPNTRKATKLKKAAHSTAARGDSTRDHRRNGVRRVMPSVGEIEDERHRDDNDGELQSRHI